MLTRKDGEETSLGNLISVHIGTRHVRADRRVRRHHKIQRDEC